MVFTTLLYNAALLLALGYLYSLIARHWEQDKVLSRVYKGLLFGGVVLAVMINPVTLMPGVVFDTRSIVASIAGLFGGPIPALIAVVIASAFRLWEGGIGTFTGVLVVFSSSLIGSAFYFWGRKSPHAKRPTTLYGFGVLVHVAMLLCMFTLPWPLSLEVLKKISLPVILIYPLVTMLLALMLAEGEKTLKIEKALKVSEEKFRLNFDHSSIGMIMTGIDGTLLNVNDHFCQMLGYTYEELTGLNFNNITHPDDRETSSKTVEQLLSGKVISAQFEKRYLHKNGETIWCSISTKLLKDNQNDIHHFITTAQNITEKKRLEEELFRSQKDLQKSQRMAKLGSWRLDVETNEVYWTEELYRMYGFDPNLPPPPYTEHMKLFTPESWELLSTSLAKTVETGVPYELELEMVKPDGSNGWMWVLGEAIKDENGKTVELWGAARDITEGYLANQALKESEAMLANMASQVPGMLYQFRVAPDGTSSVPYSSQGIKDIFGCSPEDVRDDFAPIFMAIHSEDRAEILRTIDESVKHMSQWMCEYRVQIPGEPIKWVYGNSIPEKRADGSIVWSGYNVDITERKQAEEQRQEALDLLNNLARLVPGVIYQYRLYPDGRSAFPYSSPGMYDIYEVTPEEVREDASVVFGRIHPEDHDRVAEAIFESARTLKTFYCELRVILPEKGICWRWSQAHPERTEDGGTLWHGIILDITERKQAEQALRQSEEQYRLLVNTAQDAIYIIADGKLVFVNPQVERVTGLSAKELADTDFRDLIHPDDLEMALNSYQRRLAGESVPDNYPIRVVSKDGRIRWIQASAVRLSWKGRPAILYIARDITEQKNLESQLRQAQKMEAIGTLAGGIAHDFNNILAAIMGYAELAHDDALSGEVNVRDIDRITAAAERAKKLVQQILTYSRNIETQKEPMDLNQEVHRSLELLQHTIPKMISIKTQLAPDLGMVEADSSQISQVLLNLANNALQAMPNSGEVTITTKNLSVIDRTCVTCGENFSGDWVLLTISDTGPGIDPQNLPKIFDPFFTTKEVGQGTGLGLSMVHGVVKSHKGHIECDSQLGRGTTFKIYFPLHQSMKITESKVVKPHSVPGGNENVLLVDDEEALRQVGERILTKTGYQVQTASSGEEALEIYEINGERVNVVIMDLGMPGMGGHKALKSILEINPEARIIIASGYAADDQVKAALESGATDYVAKPFKQAELLATVRSVLDKN
ncbi:MAG: PAS domain S-box protein [Desulfarculaceae bacterium]|nr:PAS domain S-box protein [Desulfarculaceae bacterium]MCF8072956.1 PAS domain S-box protein [Desulfarculaceae bacterium]MCF8100748.1 PAS domain S-box protein [Desulfarculaceae bacterium]MCF8115486.1 PAS domain S-box protein [Desulfarculaceae bacterium]